jgi:hypothetical protein
MNEEIEIVTIKDLVEKLSDYDENAKIYVTTTLTDAHPIDTIGQVNGQTKQGEDKCFAVLLFHDAETCSLKKNKPAIEMIARRMNEINDSSMYLLAYNELKKIKEQLEK